MGFTLVAVCTVLAVIMSFVIAGGTNWFQLALVGFYLSGLIIGLIRGYTNQPKPHTRRAQ